MTSERQPDFIAKLYYLTPIQGGRQTHASSGYRPHIKFSHSEYLTSGEQRFLDRETVAPGEATIAEIRIMASDIFNEDLENGMMFKFCEGNRTIGYGEITEVANPTLQKSKHYISSDLANLFSKELEFNKIENNRYEAASKGKSIVLRMNNFPEFPLWTLWYGSKSMDFDDTPNNWKINL